MKTYVALAIATLLSVPIPSMAATVDYQHPDITILAKGEPLDAVLKSLGKEMRIYITVPTGLNPTVSCDIQQQPVKQALKTLLGDVSYSLEWEEGGERLVGLTILAGGNGAAVAAVPDKPAPGASTAQNPVATPVTLASPRNHGAQAPVEQGDAMHDTALADRETAMAEHDARMETERAEHEARMVEERAAQEERMKEEVARHDAEMAAYLESQGLSMPQ